jgi:hypothetical protein
MAFIRYCPDESNLARFLWKIIGPDEYLRANRRDWLQQYHPKELVLIPRLACTLEEWARHLRQPILAGQLA